MNLRINVLGTEYTIMELSAVVDKKLCDCDGYCDKTTKRIVITQEDDDCDLGDFEQYRKKVLRHEIVHAFLFESGLHECWEHECGHDETYVDWIATQFPKLLKAFEAAGAL